MLFLWAFLGVMALMTLLWIISIPIRNVSIVDIFWSIGFIVAYTVYFLLGEGSFTREWMVFGLVGIWGLRLALHLFIRNYDKGEDFRYQQFRKDYGPKRYWWFSFFQVFLLQGTLVAIISLPLLGINTHTNHNALNPVDYLALTIWLIGFLFESVGDYQLSKFKADPANKGKVLDTGLWRYTRHPNYFGDAAVWWSYGLFAIAAGAWWYAVGSVIMTYLIIRISGVSLLERSLNDTKPKYREYVARTSAFMPWFPKKKPI
jgi:steroid 5-alpha reductase family enzyme